MKKIKMYHTVYDYVIIINVMYFGEQRNEKYLS